MPNPFFNSILQGMKEALAHARGEITLPTRECPGTLIPIYRVLEAEPEQHSPPKRETEGSNPSEDSNSDNL